MNFSHFFIKRPIFAAVLSIAIFVMGLLAMFKLPIIEYPEVVPPTIVVRATYPGATPKTIAETVASPLEQSITGVEGAIYTFSQATGDGVLTITVTFNLGTDIDKAQVQVQNRVSQALPKLPEEVRDLGSPPPSNRPTSRWSSTCSRPTTATTTFISATTPRSRSRMCSPASPAPVTSNSSAPAITPCGSG